MTPRLDPRFGRVRQTHRKHQPTALISLENLPVVFPMQVCHASCRKPNERKNRCPARHAGVDGPDVLGSLHGYGIARRIEQISGDLLSVNQGTLYPVLLKLEQEGSIASEWGVSENKRKARFYRLTRDGRKQLRAETRSWEDTAAIIARFFAAKAENLK
jgi:PadR family transcriptional regulator PadR